MIHQLNMSDLRRLGKKERDESLSALARSARTNGEAGAAMTQSKIREFEIRYEMTSVELLKGLEDETVRETADVAEWLFLLSSRQRYVAE